LPNDIKHAPHAVSLTGLT